MLNDLRLIDLRLAQMRAKVTDRGTWQFPLAPMLNIWLK